MEPVGLLVAAIVTFAVTTGFGYQNIIPELRTLDQTWRIIAGVGAVPALIAIILRLTIPESPRFTMDVLNKVDKAYVSVQVDDKDLNSALSMSVARMIGPEDPENVFDSDSVRSEPLKLKHYLLHQGNWRYLAAVSACWFLLDWAYYSLDGSSSTTVNMIWPADVDEPLRALPISSWRSTILVSVGSVVGVLTIAIFVNYKHRSTILTLTFLCGAAVLTVAGVTLLHYPGSGWETATIILYAICYYILYLGE